MKTLRRSPIRWSAPWIALAACVALAGCGKPAEDAGSGAAEQRIVWKMASAFPGSLPIVGDSGPYFSDKVSRLSRGRLEVKFYEPGKLVPPLEIFDAVSKGSVDAGWSNAGYWIGKIPSAVFFGAVPFGPDTNEFLGWIYHGGGWELWQEIYARHNVFPIPCQLTPPEASGWFRAPITSLDQLKGLKMRFAGNGGQAIQRLGASVQLLASGDIYPALERGVIDATEFANPSLDEQLGLHRIAKHYYFPGWHQPSTLGEFIVNLDRWKSLDATDQELLVTICRDVIVRDVALGDQQQIGALKRIQEQGVTVHFWPDEFLRAFKAESLRVIEENAAKDADVKRVWESYRRFRDGFANWAHLSRVPVNLK